MNDRLHVVGVSYVLWSFGITCFPVVYVFALCNCLPVVDRVCITMVWFPLLTYLISMIALFTYLIYIELDYELSTSLNELSTYTGTVIALSHDLRLFICCK